MQKRTVEDTDRESSLESRMNMLQTTDIIAPPVEDGAADFLTRYIPLRFRSTSDFASSSTIGCYPNHQLSTYLVPIPSTEDTIAVYDKSLRAGVMAFIAETDIRWSMIGIVRAGRRDASGPTRSEGETTFLRVAVYPKSINVEMAKKIVSGLYALLHSAQMDQTIGIEVVEGGCIPYNTNCETTIDHLKYPFEQVYQQDPPVGSSIGIREPANGINSSGTLGPVFRYIAQNGTVKDFGLTCHHVVSRSRSPIATVGVRNIIDCPSEEDHELFTRNFKQDINFFIRQFSITAIKQEAGAPLNPTVLSIMDKEKNKSDKARDNLKHADSFDRCLGEVFTSSGLDTTQTDGTKEANRDWALIELSPLRFPKRDTLANVPPLPTLLEALRKLYRDFPRQDDVAETAARTAGSKGSIADLMEESLPVFKIGRSTGTTVGRVHGHKMDVRTEYSTDESSSPVVVYSCEVVVFTCNSQAPGTFSAPGDSGAGVYDGHGRVVGVLWGGWPAKRVVGGQLDSIHCITPIEIIEEDIRRRMDGDLELL